MKTIQTDETRNSALREEYRLKLLGEIRAALPWLTQEQKEFILEWLQALVEEAAD